MCGRKDCGMGSWGGARAGKRIGLSREGGRGSVKASVGQVRGVLAERVVVSTALDPFLPLTALATYSGLSVRKLRDLLDDAARPLPCYRIGGKILVRRSDYDGWAAAFRCIGRRDVENIVNDVLASLPR
jgi:hypothetical protein